MAANDQEDAHTRMHEDQFNAASKLAEQLIPQNEANPWVSDGARHLLSITLIHLAASDPAESTLRNAFLYLLQPPPTVIAELTASPVPQVREQATWLTGQASNNTWVVYVDEISRRTKMHLGNEQGLSQ